MAEALVIEWPTVRWALFTAASAGLLVVVGVAGVPRPVFRAASVVGFAVTAAAFLAILVDRYWDTPGLPSG